MCCRPIVMSASVDADGDVAIVATADFAMPGAIVGDIEMMFGYDISTPVDDLRETYQYNETCQATVPEAIRCFMEAEDFEDAIRNAISIGGDSDTLAAITGSIAEAVWGVPKEIERETMGRLDEALLETVQRFTLRFPD